MTGKWRAQAACRPETGANPDWWWPHDRARETRQLSDSRLRLATHICRRHCPVRADCLTWARQQLDQGTLFPCIAGGHRWVASNHEGETHSSRANKRAAVDPAESSINCPHCEQVRADLVPQPGFHASPATRARAAALAADPTLRPHGTRQTYSRWGCRCDDCTAAETAYQRGRRARQREAST